MEKIFLNNLGDLVQAQRASYYRLLTFGLSEEISKGIVNPIFTEFRLNLNKNNIKKTPIPYLIYLYPHELKLRGPIFSLDQCRKRDYTYAMKLYLSAHFYPYAIKINKKKEKFRYPIFRKDLLIGELPLIREDGTFLLNGCERVVINQIIRSPGIYFRKEYHPIKPTIYTATIISDRGVWTKFYYEEKKVNDYGEKINLNEKERLDEDNECVEEIYTLVNTSKFAFSFDFLPQNRKKKSEIEDELGKLSIYEILRYYGLSDEEIFDSLNNPSLAKSHEIYSEKSEIEETNEDVEFLISPILGAFSLGKAGRYKVNKKFGLKLPASILTITPIDLLQIVDGLIELKYLDRQTDDIDDLKNKQVRSIGELLQNQIRQGIMRMTADREPSFFPQKKYGLKLTEFGIDPRIFASSIREFFITSQLSQYADQTNALSEIAHKRKITVFGPNGLKQDHVSPLVRDIHSSQYGRFCPIETPEGQIAGLVSSLALLARIHPLGSVETPYFFAKEGTIFPKRKVLYLSPEQEVSASFALHSLPLIKGKIDSIPYVFSKEKNFFSERKTSEINFLTTSPLQILSLSVCLIPFLEHDDANRALMGANMQRQAVPLLYPEKPRVGTGLEASIPLDSDMVLKSYCEGIVIYSSSSRIEIKDEKGQILSYFLSKYRKSNQETSLNQRSLVWIGEKVFSGQILVDATCTEEGELALGKNLTVAYMPWEGYNYEDAIVINERLITDDCLSSLHIHQYETTLTFSLVGAEKLTKEVSHGSEHLRRNLNSQGIIKLGSYVTERDILVGKLTPYMEAPSPETKLLQALYGVKGIGYQETSLRVPKGIKGRVIDIRTFATNNFSKEESHKGAAIETIRIYVAQIRKIQVGDKLSGRHGNKGVISRVLSPQDMPYLPDGSPVDLVLNPLGVPSRMNVGQVFESLLGFAGEKLGKRFYVVPFDEMYGEEASRILINQKLKEASKKPGLSWIYSSFSPGKIFLRDGRTGEFFDNGVLVGKSYILKLIHLVEEKIHARATGPYAMITEQPLAGKAHRGGQRFGEMEVWALEAYGAAYTLQELLTLKSDDVDGRNDLYEALALQPYKDIPTPNFSEAFLGLVRELHALGLNFTFHKIHLGEQKEGITKQEIDAKSLSEVNVFDAMEKRLKLRAHLSRARSEFFGRKLRLVKTSPEIQEKYQTTNKGGFISP